MNYSTKNKIEFDDSPFNRFIRQIFRAVELFDVGGRKEPWDDKLHSLVGRMYAGKELTPEPDFNLPLVCFMKILHPDYVIAFHYAVINSYLKEGSNPFTKGAQYYYEYLVLCTYIIHKEEDKFLQEDFSELYTILERKKLLDLVETELEKIILMNC